MSSSMPVGDLPGWTQVYTEDFLLPAALGQIGTVYGADMRGYNGFTDTSGHGTYSPDLVLSAADSMLDYYLHTESGLPRVATAIPMGYTGQTYGRYSLRYRTDQMTGYKMAFLLWPSSDVWNDGEIDWPEGELGSIMLAHSAEKGTYNSGTGGITFDPSFYKSDTDSLDWHVATIDWMPGVVKFYWDDAFITQTSVPAGVPNTNFRWTLQAETSIGGPAPDSGAEGHLQVDWLVAYSYNGGTPNPTALISSAIDSFDDVQSSSKMWSFYGTDATQIVGEVQLQATTNYPSLRSRQQYVFTGSSVYANIAMPSSNDSSIQVRFRVQKDEVNHVRFDYLPGYLRMIETVNGTDDSTFVVYNSVTHAWLRIREAAGIIYWEAASDGVSWSILRSKTTTIDFSETIIAFNAGNYNNVTTPGYCGIRSINTIS